MPQSLTPAPCEICEPFAKICAGEEMKGSGPWEAACIACAVAIRSSCRHPASPAAPADGWRLVPLNPDRQMKTEGGRRLLQFQDGSTDASFTPLQWAAVRNEAERVWRSMWLASPAHPKAPADHAGLLREWMAFSGNPMNEQHDDLIGRTQAALSTPAPATDAEAVREACARVCEADVMACPEDEAHDNKLGCTDIGTYYNNAVTACVRAIRALDLTNLPAKREEGGGG